jgi:putative oxidoreductase
VDILVLIGRIVFSSLFILSGFNHFANGKAMAGYAAAKGVPQALAATYAGGVLLLAGGLSVLFGIWADLGSLLLVIFLVPTALLMHGFWKAEGQERIMEMVQFQKDLALAGASLMLLALFSFVGDALGLTITGPLFNIS